MKNYLRKGKISQKIIFMCLVIIVFMILFPLLFMIMNSFKSDAEYKTNYWIPDLNHIQLDNYVFAFKTVSPYIMNSIIVSLSATAGVLILAVISAYVFSRFEFPFKKTLFTAVIMIMMVPGVLTFVPAFVVCRNLHLLNSLWALILPGIATGQIFAIFILRSFFEQVSKELLESARIDGAKEKDILVIIIVPITIPMIMTLGVISILGIWNSYLWPLVTITDQAKWTIPIGINFLTSSNFDVKITQQFASYTVASIPLFVLFAFTMNYFIDGLTSGAVKV